MLGYSLFLSSLLTIYLFLLSRINLSNTDYTNTLPKTSGFASIFVVLIPIMFYGVITGTTITSIIKITALDYPKIELIALIFPILRLLSFVLLVGFIFAFLEYYLQADIYLLNLIATNLYFISIVSVFAKIGSIINKHAKQYWNTPVLKGLHFIYIIVA